MLASCSILHSPGGDWGESSRLLKKPYSSYTILKKPEGSILGLESRERRWEGVHGELSKSCLENLDPYGGTRALAGYMRSCEARRRRGWGCKSSI
jgi:hypothetical protein